MRTSELGH